MRREIFQKTTNCWKIKIFFSPNWNGYMKFDVCSSSSLALALASQLPILKPKVLPNIYLFSLIIIYIFYSGSFSHLKSLRLHNSFYRRWTKKKWTTGLFHLWRWTSCIFHFIQFHNFIWLTEMQNANEIRMWKK